MEYIPGIADNQVRALLQLLKSLMQTKSQLTFEVNELSIKESHNRSNPMVRDYKEVANLSKILRKKLSEMSDIQAHLNIKGPSDPCPDTVNSIISLISSSEENISQAQNLLNEFEESQNLFLSVKERWQQLNEQLERKKLSLAISSKYLIDSPELEVFKELMTEVKEYQEELAFYRAENEKMTEKKEHIGKGRRKSFEKVKLYKQVSENAMKLRSKTLIRDDLEKNIKKAEAELQLHFQRVEREKSRMELLESEDPSSRTVHQFSSELKELENEIRDLEKEIEGLYSEREELINPVALGLKIDGSSEQPEDNVTVSIVSILAGLTEMRLEKESLIEQNNKLKERITNLFNAKV